MLSQVKLIAEPWDVGPGGYQVGNFPIAVDGVERRVPRQRSATSGAARRRLPSSPSASPARRPLRGRRPPAGRVDQLRHRPRRLHAARPRLLQREAQRGQPGGQPGRHRRQPLVELRRRRRRPTTPRSTRCAPASSATSSPRCCSRRACRCCSAATRSAARQRGNNNAWCQDNEISWFDWDERRPRAARVRPAGDRAAPDEPVFRRRDFFVGEVVGSGLPDVVWCARRRGHDRGGLAAGRRALAGRVPQRRGDPHATAHGNRIRGDSFLLMLNAHHEPVEFTVPGGGDRRALEDRDRRPPTSPGPTSSPQATKPSSRSDRCCCSDGSTRPRTEHATNKGDHPSNCSGVEQPPTQATRLSERPKLVDSRCGILCPER